MSHILNLIYWFSKQILNSHGLRFAGVKIAKVDNGFVSRNILGVCKQNQTVPAAHLSHKLWNTTTLSGVLLLSLPVSWRSQHSPCLLSTFLERAVLCDLLTQSTLRFFFSLLLLLFFYPPIFGEWNITVINDICIHHFTRVQGDG